MKLIMEIDNNHTYIFCMKYCVCVSKNGGGNNAKFELMCDKFNMQHVPNQ